MLEPSYLAGCADELGKLFAQLEADITSDIAKRIVRMGRYTEASAWQAQKLRESMAAYDMCNRLVQQYRRKASKEIEDAFLKGSAEAMRLDDKIYKAAGMHASSIASSEALMDVIIAGAQKTNGVMDNLTMTTAVDASHAIQDALDRAYMQVSSGAYSFDQAARHTIVELGNAGYRAYSYRSGTHTSLEAASRRALITGLNQTTAQLQLARAQELNSNLVEVTAHAGARPSHAVWQGEIYSLTGSTSKYRNFYTATGYGTGAGLCGWNCYHSFYPYIEGISTPSFSKNPAAELGRKNNELYEQTQGQRYLERQVRQARRKCQTIDAAASEAEGDLKMALDDEFAKAAVSLKRKEAKLRAYCERLGLPYDATRVVTYGFGRSVSAKAVWANRKASEN